jgi:hypothetical protein
MRVRATHAAPHAKDRTPCARVGAPAEEMYKITMLMRDHTEFLVDR